MNKSLLRRLSALTGTAAVASCILSPRLVQAQQPQTFFACYVPDVGAIYMIKISGLPANCLSVSHVEISWTEDTPDTSITTAKLADSSVTTPKLANSSVTTAKLADSAITAVKIAAGAIPTVPVGTILASMLDPSTFVQEVGSGWVLADGRDAAGSAYATLTGNSNIPDLRGMFLRALNVGRPADGLQDPDGAGRVAGDVQLDTFAIHRHGTFDNAASGVTSGGNSNYLTISGTSAFTLLAGGSESRPNNVAVYYYIKID